MFWRVVHEAFPQNVSDVGKSIGVILHLTQLYCVEYEAAFNNKVERFEYCNGLLMPKFFSASFGSEPVDSTLISFSSDAYQFSLRWKQ